METGCHSLHRLKHRAVITLIMVCSLLFYIMCMHIHYYQKLIETVGVLKNFDQELQQKALYSLFTGSVDVEDGKYVLMKNGYQFSGKYFVLIDSFPIAVSLGYLTLMIILLYIYKVYLINQTKKLENELDYLKIEVEHFLFGENINRNSIYKESNYLLDRLEQRVYDVKQRNENELRKATNFHQNIVHQINTPLNTIKILVEHLYETGKINSDYLKDINYAIEKASDLAQIYLRSSKMEMGRVNYSFEEIELHELIEELFISLKIYAEYNHIELINECENFTIYADAVWIKEAISNIIKNSIEYANEGTRVIISSDYSIEKNIIYIDNDCVLENINLINFERFESSQTGIGTGLHLCKQIIETHLGEIYVRQRESGGLRFIIKLPKMVHKEKIDLED